jgi:hypothetical protein
VRGWEKIGWISLNFMEQTMGKRQGNLAWFPFFRNHVFGFGEELVDFLPPVWSGSLRVRSAD